MQKYQAIDEQQVIQASAVDPKTVTPSAPLITDFTIISSETPQPIRQNFISRVYIILWFQLLVTSTFIGLCNQNKPVQKFLVSQAGLSIMWLSMICILIMSCCLMCISSSIRKCPGSCMYLTLFTGCMSYIMGYIGIAYKLTTLLLAGLSTLGIFSGLTLYAVQTKYDYTEMGGYLIACAGDEIYANSSSIIGSIGVISASFGFKNLIEKIGVQRRVYTAGKNKSTLDPFLDEKEEDIKRLKSIQLELHQDFIDVVEESRGEKLNKDKGIELFSGEFWTGKKAKELGLIDGLGNSDQILREKFGEEIEIKKFGKSKGWLAKKFSSSEEHADKLLSIIEERSIWQRYGF